MILSGLVFVREAVQYSSLNGVRLRMVRCQVPHYVSVYRVVSPGVQIVLETDLGWDSTQGLWLYY